jgi:hypothetical protein
MSELALMLDGLVMAGTGHYEGRLQRGYYYYITCINEEWNGMLYPCFIAVYIPLTIIPSPSYDGRLACTVAEYDFGTLWIQLHRDFRPWG